MFQFISFKDLTVVGEYCWSWSEEHFTQDGSEMVGGVDPDLLIGQLGVALVDSYRGRGIFIYDCVTKSSFCPSSSQ